MERRTTPPTRRCATGRPPSPGPAVTTSVAAVLFCDVRGFTAIAGRLEPARVLELLACYYETLCPAVRASEVDALQCCGDEIFATFRDDDGATAARRALASALDMLDRGGRLNRRLRALGLPEVSFGIGIHVGPVAFGPRSPGSPGQAAVAGNTVNLGHRHCAAAGGGEIVVSAECREALGSVAAFEERAATILKGVATPVSVFVVRPPVATASRGHRSTGGSAPSGRRDEVAGRQGPAPRRRARRGSRRANPSTPLPFPPRHTRCLVGRHQPCARPVRGHDPRHRQRAGASLSGGS